MESSKIFRLGLYKGGISNICLKRDDKISFDYKTSVNTFNEFFCNLASDLVAKLPPSFKKFGISSVSNYYQNILVLPPKFKFSSRTEDFLPKLLKDVNIDKTAGIDSLSEKFLKVGVKRVPQHFLEIIGQFQYSL